MSEVEYDPDLRKSLLRIGFLTLPHFSVAVAMTSRKSTPLETYMRIT